MRELPAGMLTFLFTDIEGSTRLLREMGEAYVSALAEHRRVLREVFARHEGFEMGTEGDAFFVVFRSAAEASAAAAEGQAALQSGPVRVRMGMHTGEPVISEADYVGLDVHLAARIAACGHGGQVVLSAETKERLGDAIPALDLGEHRLKDFDEPVRLFQLGDGRFPPLRTISNTNLPRPASSFVGREHEVTEVLSLLRNGARLLTLTGPGGSGKTRLAIEAAAELVPEFKAGVFWTGLAALRDPSLVTNTIAQTLGAKDGLAAHIGERELLLVLDNFEQVVDAAPELSSLLAACPNLKLLVTSRELLRVQGEVEYAVPPLAQPEAVKLFCTRSRLEPDETITELCRRLDDLPLAVELAAARTSVLTPAQILDRLGKRLDLLKGGRDADPRQATLRATIEWSYELLSQEEKVLFSRLAVFAVGCTLKSAEDVTQADVDTLQSLVDKSVVRRTNDRFWMLETIREYALERLDESGEAHEMRKRHAEHFLTFVERVEPELFGSSPEEWAERLEPELDNFRGAFAAFASSSESHLALRLAGALSEFWYLKNHVLEGQRYLEDALHREQAPTAARAKALNAAANLDRIVGESATAKRRAEEALALHRRLGDAWGTANSRCILGLATADQGDREQARDLFAQSSSEFRGAGDEHNALWAARFLAWMYFDLGDPARARAQHLENLGHARTFHYRGLEADTLGALGEYDLYDGLIREGVTKLKNACAIFRELGDDFNLATSLCRFAQALTMVGRYEEAVALLASAEAIHEELGTRAMPWLVEVNGKTLARLHAQLDEAAFAQTWEQGRRLRADEAVALALEAWVDLRQSDPGVGRAPGNAKGER